VLRRRHLIEIHEQPWCPRSLRDSVTDAIGFFTFVGRPFDVVREPLMEAIRASGADQVVDLCSGAGGPWLDLARDLEDSGVQVVLTDLHPNEEAFRRARRLGNGRIRSHPDPVDARAVPESLGGFRTLFTSFHHFRPEEARRVIEDAVRRGQGIGVFEAQERGLGAMLFFLLYLPLTLVAVPFMRPFRWSRLFWTYVVPALPLVVTFDAVVSCLRTHEPEELQEMAEDLGAHARTGRVPARWLPLRVTHLVALPPRKPHPIREPVAGKRGWSVRHGVAKRIGERGFKRSSVSRGRFPLRKPCQRREHRSVLTRRPAEVSWITDPERVEQESNRNVERGERQVNPVFPMSAGRAMLLAEEKLARWMGRNAPRTTAGRSHLEEAQCTAADEIEGALASPSRPAPASTITCPFRRRLPGRRPIPPAHPRQWEPTTLTCSSASVSTCARP
jgi:hypothetical protein